MTGVDRELLAERSAAVLRHLDRVAEHLPADPAGLTPPSDLRRVHAIASAGPADLTAFLVALRGPASGGAAGPGPRRDATRHSDT